MPLLTGLGKKRKRLLQHTAVVLGVSIVFALLTLAQPFASLNWRLSDQLFLSETPSPNIVIAAIDDQTLSAYGRLGDWPRSLHAQAIANLSAAGARAIGFDVLFAETSAEDSTLATAISQAGNVVLAVTGTQLLPDLQGYNEFIFPVPVLAQAASALGHTNLSPDGDGIVRRIPLLLSDPEGKTYPGLPLAVLQTFFSQPPPQSYELANGKLHLLSRDIPVDTSRNMRINYVGGPGAFRRLSYKDVIQGNFDPEVVKHKIVIIGMTATGTPDTWGVPVSAEKMPGVEIHANVMDTILRQRFLTAGGNGINLVAILLLGIISSIALPRLSLRWGAVLLVVMLAGYVAAVFFSFERGYLLPLFYPLTAVPLVYVTAVLCRIVATQSDRSEIRSLFGRYVSPEVADTLLKLTDHGELELGGENREVTVLFADARGFTEISARLSPEETMNMLNTYFSVIIERITANKGMVNKFAGDNVLAVWNAPQLQANHALLAVKAAVESQQAILQMQQGSSSVIQMHFGMGINSGEAVAGSMGSKGRSEYTVIGDTVNLASRICSVTPGGQIWIGSQTYEQVKEKIAATELEPQQFKGKSQPVPVFRVTAIMEMR